MEILKQVSTRGDGGTNVFYKHKEATVLAIIYCKDVDVVVKHTDKLLKNLGYTIKEVKLQD